MIKPMDHYYHSGDQIQDYSILETLGEGRYGIVYLAERNHLGKCIIKQLKKKMLKRTKDKLFYEEEILSKLNSPYFPRFIEKLQTWEIQGYVMEYVEGTVFEDLIAIDDHKFTKKEIYEVASKLLALIEILQKNNIVHRDIRLPNVIQKENQDLVLLDFGLARYIDDKKYVKEMDYWYLGDFLLHLYYTSYDLYSSKIEKPWYKELDLNHKEKLFLKRLLGIEKSYTDIEEVKNNLLTLKKLL